MKIIIVGCGKIGKSLAENLVKLTQLDTAVEKPNLQQLSVGILRKAEKDGE